MAHQVGVWKGVAAIAWPVATALSLGGCFGAEPSTSPDSPDLGAVGSDPFGCRIRVRVPNTERFAYADVPRGRIPLALRRRLREGNDGDRVAGRNGMVFRGNPGIPDSPQGDDHEGLYDPSTGKVHIDGNVLDTFPLRRIATLLVHEAWHAYGHTHPGETQYPYTAWPFSEQDACVM